MNKKTLSTLAYVLSIIFVLISIYLWGAAWVTAVGQKYFIFGGLPTHLSLSAGLTSLWLNTALYLALPVVGATLFAVLAEEMKGGEEKVRFRQLILSILPLAMFMLLVSILAALPLWLVWMAIGAALSFGWGFVLLVVGLLHLLFTGDWDSLLGIVVLFILLAALFGGGRKVIGVFFWDD